MPPLATTVLSPSMDLNFEFHHRIWCYYLCENFCSLGAIFNCLQWILLSSLTAECKLDYQLGERTCRYDVVDIINGAQNSARLITIYLTLFRNGASDSDSDRRLLGNFFITIIMMYMLNITAARKFDTHRKRQQSKKCNL